LISELSEWVQLISNLNERILNAESTRITAHDTQNRLISLQNEYQDKKSKSSKGMFGRNQGANLEDLEKRISEASDAEKSLSAEYQSAKNAVSQQVKQLMEKRYRYFDRIYVQMLECQAEYFQHAAMQSKRFQRDIDYYRKQYPKTNSFRDSNGSTKDNPFKPQHSKKNSTSQQPSPTTKPIKTKKEKNKKPKVPKTAPPTLPAEDKEEIHIKQPKEDDIIQTNMNKSKSSPPTMSKEEYKTMDRHRSTHDILNLHGPMSPQQPVLPKVSKQDSMFSGILNDDQYQDDHGLLDLGNPNQNDMLLGFSDNDKMSQSMNNLPKHKKTEQNDDIFGDFWGGDTKQGSKGQNKALHGSQDSTTDWLMGSHEPKQVTPDKVPINGSKKSLEDQMNSNFNAASYGGGHGHHNGHNQSPQTLQKSTTQKINRNGAHKINNKDLSETDKQKMATMKLSKKAQENAEKAYQQKMNERKQKEEKEANEMKERLYWKEKHCQKLNEWEFDNTVRRNIRTLIGKLPDVLPNGLNWKPIPMTKLLNDAQLKKGYYKAVRVVHPDKSIGRGDPIETQVVCDYVFQALEQAFNTKFG